jgi:ADP-ribose pyrophosphatase
MPTLLLAVKTGEGTANILTVAWAGIAGSGPAMIALRIGGFHYSTPFIDRELSFTANVPSSSQIKGVEYCGTVSGREDPDKARTCGWTLLPATQVSSPIIAECPVNFECRVVRKTEIGLGAIYLAEILQTHVDERILAGPRNIDPRALDPVIYGPDGNYYALGPKIADSDPVRRQAQLPPPGAEPAALVLDEPGPVEPQLAAAIELPRLREKLRSSRTVFEGRVITVRVDEFDLGDGKVHAREIVAHGGSVVLVAIDRAERVVFVRQFRHGAGDELWELPAGMLEQGEDPAAAASRELAEETGLSPGRLEPLADFYVSPGYCTELLHLYLATDLAAASPGAGPDEDERIQTRWFALREAEAMCLDGRVRDAKTIAGILVASALLRAER